MIILSATDNQFTNRDEVFFVEYDGIIKNSNQFILHKIFGELYDSYKDFLNIEEYKDADLPTCLTYAALLADNNPLYALRKDDFDVVDGYMDLYDYYPDMYEKSDDLIFNVALERTVSKPFCKKIYIYSRYKDSRIEEDLKKKFEMNDKIVYCYGEFSEILKEIPEKITAFFLSDYDKFYDLAFYEFIDYTELYLADYVYNRFRNAEGELVSYITQAENIFGDSIVKFNVFTPLIIDKTNVVNIKK